jgi:flagellar motor switch protein FliN/FliY
MSPNPESNNPADGVEKTAAAEAATPESGAEAASENPTTAGPAAAVDADTGVEVQTPEYQSFAGQAGTPTQTEIARFHDLKVTVSAELGRTSIPIQQLLSLGSGSVLELDRSIHSPIELIAQGVPLASGEVVVVDDCFAIRITEVYPTRRADDLRRSQT